MPTSNFKRQQRDQSRQQRDAQREERRINRRARRTVRGLKKVENGRYQHATAAKVRATFERSGAQSVPPWRPLAERLPAWITNSVWILVLLLLLVLESRYIVADAVSLQGEDFQKGWSAWLWVAAVGAMLYATLLFAKLHPVSEAAEAHEAADSDEEDKRTRGAWRTACLAKIGYVGIVLFVSGLSWHHEQIAKAKQEQMQKDISDTKAMVASGSFALVEPAAKTAEPLDAALAPVGERPEESPWVRARDWLVGYLFGGIRPWILAGHFLLLLWPLNLSALAEPATYEQALRREEKYRRAESRAANAVRPLVFSAHEAHEAGDSRLYDRIRGSLKPSTITVLDTLWNEPAAPIAPAAPPAAPQGPTQPPTPEPPPAPQNGPQAGGRSEPEPPLDPFEGLA